MKKHDNKGRTCIYDATGVLVATGTVQNHLFYLDPEVDNNLDFSQLF